MKKFSLDSLPLSSFYFTFTLSTLLLLVWCKRVTWLNFSSYWFNLN